MRLPLTLLCLVQAWLVASQPAQLALNNLRSISGSTLSNPATFSLPVSTSPLSISVALCSAQSSYPPRFFVANDSTTQPGPTELGQPNVFEIPLENGLGSWTGRMDVIGILAIFNASQTSLEVGVSNNGPIHEILDSLPLLGDTTSNQALLFSPPFSPPEVSTPTYPNYTLPPANLTFPAAPSSPPNFSMFVAPTTSSALASLPRTGCAMQAVQQSGFFYEPSAASEGLWLRDTNGWRWQWFINYLMPETNYTVYAVQNETKVAGPINFRTKTASFSCPIVYSLPFCPSVAYAAPLPVPGDPEAGITAETFPEAASDPLISGLANFTVMLTTLACGRDLYSPIVTCADCQAAYRSWLCLVSIPRCAEFPPTSSSSSSASTSPLSQPTAQQPLPALLPQPMQTNTSLQRNPNLPAFPEPWTQLLPCLEVCNAADRACPYFLGFQCPLPKYTAQYSYGVGYIDSGNEGDMGGGSTGAADDYWGNVWCNMG
ncbi:hypothetical protein AcW1_003091 [Taiwanofungus camphoratus]|nr:hypothetical protein AcW1_003091 [Antrodia cinnamomea]